MHPERYAALAEFTEDHLIGDCMVRLDPVILSFLGGYDLDDLAVMLDAAVQAKKKCEAEAYYCKFIPPPVSLKDGPPSKRSLAIYVDNEHAVIVGNDEEADRIIDKELSSRLCPVGERQDQIQPSEVERVLSNWIDQAYSGPGQLPTGIHPAAWAAAQFLEWWRGQVAHELQTAETAMRRLSAAIQAMDQLKVMEDALAELRVSIEVPKSSEEPA